MRYATLLSVVIASTFLGGCDQGATGPELGAGTGDASAADVSATGANSGSITIVLDMQPSRSVDVPFLTEGRRLKNSKLDDDVNSGLPNCQTFTRLKAGSYTVQQAVVAGVTLTDLTCESSGTDNNTINEASRSVTISLEAGESVTCTFVGYLPIWQFGDLITYSQATWGDATTDAAQLLLTNFGNVYPDFELEVGIPGSAGYSMLFTLGGTVLTYLPAAGPSGPLNGDLFNPTSTSSGSFGGEVTTLALNIDFSDAGVTLGNLGIRFGDLTLCNMENPAAVGLPLFNGLTVRQVLGGASTLLGGGTAAFYSISLWELVSNDLNGSFSAGTPTQWAQDHLVSGACP